MRLYFVPALLSALTLPTGNAFVSPRASSSLANRIVPSSSSCPIASSSSAGVASPGPPAASGSSDSNDDFYADYDPSKYEAAAASSGGDSYDRGYNTADRGERRGGGRGGRGRGRGGGRGGRGRGGDRPSSFKRPKEYLGPNGHDYVPSADAGPNSSKFSVDEIHELLATRLQAKFARDFGAADSIQSALVEGGVFVHDGTKEWRADGIPYQGSFRGGGGGGGRGGRDDNDAEYSKSPHSQPVEGASDSLINKLVNERTKFKMMRNFDKADAVREGLRSKFGVLIDDRLRQWSAGGDFGEEANARRDMADKFAERGYVKSTSSLEIEDDEEEEYVQNHVDARAKAKKDRNFEMADKIRLDLAQRFDVTINDKLKLWSVGGVFEELGVEGKVGKPRGVYTRRGGGNLSEEDEDKISRMISDRYHAKKQRNFAAADEIRDILMSEYNVRIDDRSNEWRVDTNEYAMTGTNSLSEEDVEAVESRLKERFDLKNMRMYEDSDEIRDRLREEYGVLVDDRTKEWFVDLDKMGGAAASASLEEESVESVV